MRNCNKGMTRVEVVLAVLCVVCLAAVVLPVSARERDFAKGAVAHSQVDQTLRAVRTMLTDARMTPIVGGYGTFFGDGALPAHAPAGPTLSLHTFETKRPPEHLQKSMLGAWRGPYLMACEPDPWGHAIFLTSFGDPERYTWCVSAGPNGILETTDQDRWIQGDDVGLRIY
ncbi:MAG: hypothetical protein HY286_16780 [Planctomycetes bacterium]|nr:hypothetical protein [Planctomycetota bacterium]